MTSAVDVAGVHAGDRVLMRGDLDDFVRTSSTLQVVSDLVACGVDVRRHPSLHAKAYLRELPDGSMAAWVGSANLTHKGRSDARWNANFEVMAGPFVLQETERRDVEALWDAAQPVDETYLRRARAWVELSRIRTSIGETNVLVVRIDLRLKPGSFPIPIEWFLDWRGWEGVATSVRFVTPATPLMSEGWPSVRAAVLKGFAKWFGERTGSRGEFVVAVEDYPVIAGALAEAQKLIDGVATNASVADVDKARVDFIGRATVVITTQAQSRALRVSKEEMNALLSAAFDRYIASQPSRMLYTILAPVSQPEGAFEEATESLKARVRPLFARDAEGGAAHFVGGIEEALNAAGLRRTGSVSDGSKL